MNISDFYGSFLSTNKRWTPFVEVSGPNVGQTPAEPLRVDPFLSAIAVDPYDPAGGIAIPAGRFVGIGYQQGVGGNVYSTTGVSSTPNTNRMALGDRGKTVLTLHDGKNITPAGMSVNNIFRSATTYSSNNPVSTGPFQISGNTFGVDSSNDASDVKFRRGFVAEVPYVLTVNSAHGGLAAGDRVTGFWGSITSTSNIGWMHRGKPVKWKPKQLIYQSFTASGTVVLTSAVYPGIQPRVVALWNSTTPVSAASVNLYFNGTAWEATLASASTQVLYEYGQDADQIGGEVLRIQSITDVAQQDYLKKFVELSRESMDWPPAAQMTNVTLRTDETPSTVTANLVYRVQNWPISVNHAIVIKIQGTVIDDTGTSTTYSSSSWYTLPAGNPTNVTGQFVGKYHTVNWRSGIIELSSNITSVTAITVTYSSFGARDAVLWGQGVLGLTDGRNLTTPSNDAASLVPSTNIGRTGVPSHLNYADVIGGMRIIVAD